MGLTIRLSIKAVNDSFGDYNVEVETNWTIHQLKKHLYRNYPTHPPWTSQMLFYEGRLLLDQQTLAQSLPTDCEEPVIVNLIYGGYLLQDDQTLAESLPTDCKDPVLYLAVPLEQSHSSPAISMETRDTFPQVSNRQPSLSSVQEEKDEQDQPEQQPSPVHSLPRFRGQTPPVMMGQPSHYFMSPYQVAYVNQMAMVLWYQSYYGRQAPPTSFKGGSENVEVEDEVPVNAAGGAARLGIIAGGGGDELRSRKDVTVVDVIYMCIMFIMVMLLGLMAYVTGSLDRFMVFAVILLHQGGFFAMRRLPRQPAQENHGENEQQQVEETQRTNSSDATAEEPPTPQEAQDQDQQRQGILATLFVFVISFFTSLIPDRVN